MQPPPSPLLIFEPHRPHITFPFSRLFYLIRHFSFHLLVLSSLKSMPFFSSFSYFSSHYIYMPLSSVLAHSTGSCSTHQIPFFLSFTLPPITITSILLTIRYHELSPLSCPFPSWLALPSLSFLSFFANPRCCASPPSMRAFRSCQEARATSMSDITHSLSTTPSFLWSVFVFVSVSVSVHTPYPTLSYPTCPPTPIKYSVHLETLS